MAKRKMYSMAQLRFVFNMAWKCGFSRAATYYSPEVRADISLRKAGGRLHSKNRSFDLKQTFAMLG